jgi:broad specificity phosphatase PhoE
MRLYIIRHADPSPEKDGLTQQGKLEADALGAWFAAEGLTRLYCSVTVRSFETAKAISRLTGLPVEQGVQFNEPSQLQVHQGGKDYAIWDTFGETVRGTLPLPGLENWRDRPPFDAPEVGRMWKDFRETCDAFLSSYGYVREDGRYRIRAHRDDKLGIVGHNGTVLLFLAHLLELPLSLVWTGFYAWPGSVTAIHFEEQSPTWAVPRALYVADTSAMRMAGLKPVPRGMGVMPFTQYL